MIPIASGPPPAHTSTDRHQSPSVGLILSRAWWSRIFITLTFFFLHPVAFHRFASYSVGACNDHGYHLCMYVCIYERVGTLLQRRRGGGIPCIIPLRPNRRLSDVRVVSGAVHTLCHFFRSSFASAPLNQYVRTHNAYAWGGDATLPAI